MPTETTSVIERSVPVVLAFSHQRIADMVTTAIESPVGDWFKKADASKELRDAAIFAAKARKDSGPWYAVRELYAINGFQMTVIAEDPNRGGNLQKTLTMEDFQLALILMATKDDGAYSHHFADFLRSNEDANTADLFLQFAVYGEEVYA